VETHWQAAEMFRQALEKDPNYSLAYSRLSSSYSLLSVWSALSPRDAFPAARSAAEQAIKICPESAEGHLSLAIVFWLYEWDWPAADREFKMAIELDSNYTLAPHWYGLFLAEMGRFEEAVASEKRALEIEPLSVPINADLARVFFYARRYVEANEQYQKTIEINPNSGGYYGELLEFYEVTGMSKEWYHLITKSFGGKIPTALERAYQTGGIRGFRRKAFQLSPTSFDDAWEYYFSPAHSPTEINANREAFELLDKAISARNHRIAQIKVSPRFDYLRADPHFKELLQRMNLAP
jgi:tetratricopeptide (TPR) repeat protein